MEKLISLLKLLLIFRWMHLQQLFLSSESYFSYHLNKFKIKYFTGRHILQAGSQSKSFRLYLLGNVGTIVPVQGTGKKYFTDLSPHNGSKTNIVSSKKVKHSNIWTQKGLSWCWELSFQNGNPTGKEFSCRLSNRDSFTV